VRRINASADRDQLAYHLGRNDAPEFDQGQPGRVDLARFFIEKMLLKDLTRRPLRIVELGCGSGDVSGPYSGTSHTGAAYKMPRGWINCQGIEVIGIDVVPVAKEKIQRRFPNMQCIVAPVESIEPMDCDLLVMTEFLEHLDNPSAITKAWMPKARMALIGHPLDEPDPGYEHGHSWSYDDEDWINWFRDNGFNIWERIHFPMGHWDRMVMGHGSNQR
jgi:SAM-dependent methyltransferase